MIDFQRVLKSRNAEIMPVQSEGQQWQLLPALAGDVVEPGGSSFGANCSSEVLRQSIREHEVWTATVQSCNGLVG